MNKGRKANKAKEQTDKPVPQPRSRLEKAASCATVAAAVGAIFIGWWTCSINHKLVEMSDVVAVTGVVENGPKGEMRITNTGTVNVYLVGFGGADRRTHKVYKDRRLIAVNTGGDPGYLFRMQNDVLGISDKNPSARFTLFLQDQFGRKWVSELGFFKRDTDANTSDQSTSTPRKISALRDIKHVTTSNELRIDADTCTYETAEESWQLKLPKNRKDKDPQYTKGAYFIRGSRRANR